MIVMDTYPQTFSVLSCLCECNDEMTVCREMIRRADINSIAPLLSCHELAGNLTGQWLTGITNEVPQYPRLHRTGNSFCANLFNNGSVAHSENHARSHLAEYASIP